MTYRLVSVVIPTYNRAKTVTAAIDSVLAQTYRKTEVIVVDDGSTDNTNGVLLRYGDKIRYVYQENAGAASARNHGIRIAKGEFLAFLDSDDVWMPDKLSLQVELMESIGKTVSCCLCNMLLRTQRGNQQTSFDEAGIKVSMPQGLWLNPNEVLASRFVLFNPGVVIRTEIIDKMGGFDEHLWIMEDYELALRLSAFRPWCFITKPLVVVNLGSSNSLTEQAYSDRLRLEESIREIYSRILKTHPFDSLVVDFCIRHNLSSSERHIKIAKLSQRQTPLSMSMAMALKLIDRVSNGVFRRMPWYPQLRAVPVSEYQRSKQTPHRHQASSD